MCAGNSDFFPLNLAFIERKLKLTEFRIFSKLSFKFFFSITNFVVSIIGINIVVSLSNRFLAASSSDMFYRLRSIIDSCICTYFIRICFICNCIIFMQIYRNTSRKCTTKISLVLAKNKPNCAALMRWPCSCQTFRNIMIHRMQDRLCQIARRQDNSIYWPGKQETC